MGRRGHNEGSIYQAKDGRWIAELDFGVVDGKRKRKKIYGRTRAETARKLTTALKAKQDGVPPSNDRVSVAAYLKQWLDSTKPNVKPRTWIRDEQYVRIHAIPEIGQIAVAKLSPQDLQRLYTKRLDSGSSPATVQHLHSLLHRALKQSVRWGVTARNVAQLVDPPRVPRHEMRTLTAEEARRLLSAAVGDRLEALYVLALTSGMRQGELLGLRWRNVDLEAGIIQVRESVGRIAGRGFVFAETKTGKARRVDLTPRAIDALRQHRRRQNGERLRCVSEWGDLDLVFANEVGTPIEHANLLRRSFAPLLQRAGLPHIRFHELRHTAVSLLLSAGVPIHIVSRMVGHSQIGITVDAYAHLTPGDLGQAVNAMERLLSESSGTEERLAVSGEK